MKYSAMITSTLAYASLSLCILSASSALANNIDNAAPEVPTERWFEVEVILFKHISNASKKEADSEQFSAKDFSYKKRKAFDLLTPFIQPNISNLKQLLPVCEQKPAIYPYNITIEPHNFWLENKALLTSDVESPTEENMTVKVLPEETQFSDVKLNESEYDNKYRQKYNQEYIQESSDEEDASESNEYHSSAADSNKEYSNEEQSKLEHSNDANNISEYVESPYATLALSTYTTYPSPQALPFCIIPTETITANLSPKQLEDFNPDAFPIEKLTTTISGIEQWQDNEDGEITWASDQPYLINQGSFKLKSIANSIKRSRNYASLLHLGWRQVGETRRKAKPMILFAGKNLELSYQKAIEAQEAEQLAKKIAEKKAIEQATLLAQAETATELSNQAVQYNDMTEGSQQEIAAADDLIDTEQLDVEDLTIDELTIEEQLIKQKKSEYLQRIFEEFELLTEKDTDTDTDTISTEIIADEKIQGVIANLSFDINNENKNLYNNDNSIADELIEKPEQPWYLDGIFKVHLDHYLYINSEFNILKSSNKSLKTNSVANHSSNSITDNNVVSFKQDRRVISGEIHYFDHPSIGMIVQIRRFDPTKPADEAVTQSKNQ